MSATNWLAVAANICRPTPRPCPTCEGQGWITDPAHPVGGSYEAFLFAGPPAWIDCPDCGGTGRVSLPRSLPLSPDHTP